VIRCSTDPSVVDAVRGQVAYAAVFKHNYIRRMHTMKIPKGSDVLAILLLCLAMLIQCPPVGAQATARTIVLKGARLIDGTGRLPVDFLE